MNFVGSLPVAKTQFEVFMFSNFGMSVDLSENTTFAAVAVAAVVGFVVVRMFNDTKYSR